MYGLACAAHFMVHYESMLKRLGPLITKTTIRFEAKHAYSKNIMNRTKDYINPCSTMTMRHPCLQCLHNQSVSYLLEKSNGKKASTISIEKLSESLQECPEQVCNNNSTITIQKCWYMWYQISCWKSSSSGIQGLLLRVLKNHLHYVPGSTLSDCKYV